MSVPTTLAQLSAEVIRCRRCPRLVAWRQQAAHRKPPRYGEWEYWAKPVPGFGDPEARLLIVGLAPAAHGANRTGRMFTGDRSGLWLYRALDAFGFANQPTSSHRDDGLRLSDCYITAVVRCAPPQNKPLPQELLNCRPFLLREFDFLPHLRVVIALGRIAYEGVIKAFRERAGSARPEPVWHERRGAGTSPSSPRRVSSFTTTPQAQSSPPHGPEAALPTKLPGFAHGVEVALTRRLTLLASYHPSQQNTFTGKLTEPMFHAIFRRAKDLLAEFP